ncbi:MAG: hypothetical protein ABL921_33715, partial [Pirellula sp.]
VFPNGSRPASFDFFIRNHSDQQIKVNEQPVEALVLPVGNIINGVPQEYSVNLPESDDPTTTPSVETFVVTIRGNAAGQQPLVVSQNINVDNILVAAIGDSYGSGEGTPELTKGNDEYGQWMVGSAAEMSRQNRIAHRSSFAASAQMAKMLELSDPHTSVTFVFLAASGSEIEGSIFPDPDVVDKDTNTRGIYQGIEDEYRRSGIDAMDENPNNQSIWLRPQMEQLAEIVGSRKIDTMTISLGGNDIGFANVIAGVLFLDPNDPDQNGPRYLDARDALGKAVLEGQTTNTEEGNWNEFVKLLFPTVYQLPIIGNEIRKGFDRSTAGLNNLQSEYQRLDGLIDNLAGGIPRQVLITQYPDPFSQWVNGTLKLGDKILDDLFPLSGWIGTKLEGLFQSPLEVSADEMLWVREKVIQPLNQQIAIAAQSRNWTVIDGVTKAWEGHGFTASPSLQANSSQVLTPLNPPNLTSDQPARWIVTPTESVAWQGPGNAKDSKGQVHPNLLGSKATGSLLYEAASFSKFSSQQVRTGDVLPVDFRQWLNSQVPESGTGVSFSDLKFQILDSTSAKPTWIDLDHVDPFDRMLEDFTQAAAIAAADDHHALGGRHRQHRHVHQHLVVDEFVGDRGLHDPVEHQHAPEDGRAVDGDRLERRLGLVQDFVVMETLENLPGVQVFDELVRHPQLAFFSEAGKRPRSSTCCSTISGSKYLRHTATASSLLKVLHEKISMYTWPRFSAKWAQMFEVSMSCSRVYPAASNECVAKCSS